MRWLMRAFAPRAYVTEPRIRHWTGSSRAYVSVNICEHLL